MVTSFLANTPNKKQSNLGIGQNYVRFRDYQILLRLSPKLSRPVGRLKTWVRKIKCRLTVGSWRKSLMAKVTSAPSGVDVQTSKLRTRDTTRCFESVP